MAGIAGDGDAPLDLGAGDRDVIESALNEAVQLRGAVRGRQKVGVGPVVFEKFRAEFGKLKKLCLLGELLQGLARVGAKEDPTGALHRVRLFDKGLADDIVEAFIPALIDVAVLHE